MNTALSLIPRLLALIVAGLPGLAMANETTTTTLTQLVRREAYQAGVMYFAERPGVTGFVTKADLTGQETLTARFPIYDKLSSAAISEAADFTTNSSLQTGGTVDVVVSEHAQKFMLTDLALGATVEDAINPSDAVQKRAIGESGVIGRVAAEALQRNQDQDVTALFAALDSSTGSNSGPLTSTLLINGITTLNINNVPTDRRVAILHSKQWQALLPTFDDASMFGANGAEIIATGAVGNLYGCLIFQTNNVATATVSSSTVYAGAIIHPSAIALAQKGSLPMIETERDASLRATEIVATGIWGEAEYRGGATTSGRGGAGVYFYSNTTN
jgi:hypothetical protein